MDYRKIILIATGTGVIFVMGILAFALNSSNKEPQESTVISEQSSESSKETSSMLSSSNSSSINESSSEATEQTGASRKEYEYKQYAYLEGLYFLPSWKYEGFQSLVDEYLESISKTGITEVSVIDRIDTDDDINYTFWLKLSDNTFIKGIYNINNDSYKFSIETDKSIINEYS